MPFAVRSSVNPPEFFIECDECRATTEADTNPDALVRRAVAAGWVIVEDNAYCPTDAPKEEPPSEDETQS